MAKDGKGLRERATEFYHSLYFQCACQLVAGMFVVSLFMLVNGWTWPGNCLAATLYLVCSVLIAQDCHIGTKFTAAASVMGPVMVSAVAGGITMSFAKLVTDPQGSLALLVVLSLIGLAVFATLRVSTLTPFTWALGMLSLLVYGVTVISTQFVPNPAIPYPIPLPIPTAWLSVGYLILNAFVATSIVATVACLVLPSLAGTETRIKVALALDGLGGYTSRYAAQMFDVEGLVSKHGGHASSAPAKGDKDTVLTPAPGDRSAMDLGAATDVDSELEIYEEEPDDDLFLTVLRHTTQPPPAKPHKSRSFPSFSRHGGAPPQSDLQQKALQPPPHPPVASLRPLLARARQCAVAARLEPLFLYGRLGFDVGAWMRVIGVVESLVSRVSALEAIIHDMRRYDGLLANQELREYFGSSANEHFLRTLKHVGDACQNLARDLKNPKEKQCWLPFETSDGGSWADVREELRVQIMNMSKGYWSRVRKEAGADEVDGPAPTAAEGEGNGGGEGTAEDYGGKPLAAREKSVHGGKKVAAIAAPTVMGVMFMYSLSNGILDGMAELEAAITAVMPPCPVRAQLSAEKKETRGKDVEVVVHTVPAGPSGNAPPPPKPPSPLVKHTAFLLPLAQVTFPLFFFLHYKMLLTQQLPRMFSSRQAFHATLRGRMFQAGAKMWLALSVLLTLVLVLGYYFEEARFPRPVFGYIACVLTMNEKIEATFSKIVLFVVGTAVGGVLGWAAMLDDGLATNPFGLMAIIVVATFLIGTVASTQFRTVVVLTLMTFTALILCQYDVTRTTNIANDTFFYGRVLAVCMGAILSFTVNYSILPWYNSDMVLDMLSGVLRGSVEVVEETYRHFYEDGYNAAKSAADKAGEDLAQLPQLPPRPPAGGPAGGGGPHVGGPPAAAGGGGGHGGAPAGPPPSAVQSRLAGPLTGVQVALVKDAVLWHRGVLATPRVVTDVLTQLLVLTDRVSALDLTLRKPSVYGDFNGWAFREFVLPLSQQKLVVLDAVRALTGAVAALLEVKHHDSYLGGVLADRRAAVEKALEKLEAERMVIRRQFRDRRHAFHKKVAVVSADHVPYLTHTDDTVRVLSFLFAWVKMLDQYMVLARVALSDVTKARDNWRSWLK